MPDDVLEHGPPRPPRRSVPIVVVAVAVLALAAYAAVRLGGEGPSAGAADSGPPTATTTRSSPSPTRSWPTSTGACGNEVQLPIMRPTPAALEESIGLRVVTGGAELSMMDVDSGRSTRLPGVPDGEQVDQLVRSGDDVYAVSSPCYNQGENDEAPTVLRVTDGGTDRVHFSGPVGSIIGGPSGVWGLHYADGGTSRPFFAAWAARPCAYHMRSGWPG